MRLIEHAKFGSARRAVLNGKPVFCDHMTYFALDQMIPIHFLLLFFRELVFKALVKNTRIGMKIPATTGTIIKFFIHYGAADRTLHIPF